MPIIRRYTEYAEKGDGSSAYSLTTTEGDPFRIVSVRAKFNSAPGSSELFTVSVDSKQDDSAFDTVLYSTNPNTDSATDIVWVPASDTGDPTSGDTFAAGNQINVAFPNASNKILACVITLERVE